MSRQQSRLQMARGLEMKQGLVKVHKDFKEEKAYGVRGNSALSQVHSVHQAAASPPPSCPQGVKCAPNPFLTRPITHQTYSRTGTGTGTNSCGANESIRKGIGLSKLFVLSPQPSTPQDTVEHVMGMITPNTHLCPHNIPPLSPPNFILLLQSDPASNHEPRQAVVQTEPRVNVMSQRMPPIKFEKCSVTRENTVV
ncbi:hypothetical protein NQZ68_004801 [Dissostichus eleginoides]|nr:hypothetical protein NQZ68_004801 [Dissostichus eleginoides]